MRSRIVCLRQGQSNILYSRRAFFSKIARYFFIRNIQCLNVKLECRGRWRHKLDLGLHHLYKGNVNKEKGAQLLKSWRLSFFMKTHRFAPMVEFLPVLGRDTARFESGWIITDWIEANPQLTSQLCSLFGHFPKPAPGLTLSWVWRKNWWSLHIFLFLIYAVKTTQLLK